MANFFGMIPIRFKLTFCLYLILSGTSIFNAFGQHSWIRINQLGYTEKDIKVAVLATTEKISCQSFKLVDAVTKKQVYTGTKITAFNAYAAFSKSWRLDFSNFTRPGNYYLLAEGIQSPTFTIDNKVYDSTADFILRYMRQQRSKYNPFLKDSCHTQDGFIVYHPNKSKDSTKLDVSGGWHDASDYLQYLPTSANAIYQMLFAYENNPASFADQYDAWGNIGSNQIPDILDEAKWGIDWMIKMNPDKGEYYNQIADDRDHAGMRLPTKDSVKYSTDKGLARPVYFITGQPQGEKYKNNTKGMASSAGKFASAFAKGAIVLEKFYPQLVAALKQKAIDAFDFGIQNPGNTQTISVKAPYIYAEDNDVDDMELAAITLYQLTGNKTYLKKGIQFASQEPVTPWMGADTANHYQWYPFVNLGHYAGAISDINNRPLYISFLQMGIKKVVEKGKGNPFLNGVPFIWCSNNLTVGILTQMHLYRKLTGDNTYAEPEAALRDWLFGCNPWGTSMICDLPEKGIAPKDPHSAFTHLYKYKISGGVVDGPVYGSIWKKLIGITLYEPDEFEIFQSQQVVYHDDYGDYSTNEPTMDGTASLSYYLSTLQKDAHQQAAQFDNQGAIIKLNPEQKKIYLLFSAHEFADGGTTIVHTLRKHKAKGNFFFTGDFLRNKNNEHLINQIKLNGHYIGSHSNKHLIYADWEKRDSLLVTSEIFEQDLKASILALENRGIKKGNWFLPPYEWYNKDIVQWSNDNNLTLINFTPGTGTNSDYTYPTLKNYKSTDEIIKKLFELERNFGLNGNLLLIHLGTDRRRHDKLYNRLNEIIIRLKKLGYRIEKLP